MRRILLLLVLMVLPLVVNAYDFSFNGVLYTIISETEQTVEVASSSQSAGSDGPSLYSGDVTIPSSVTFAGKEYTVIGIGESAFVNCASMKSISLPNTLTYIKKEAFIVCIGLTKITIPRNVTFIGYDIFSVTSVSEITVLNPVPAEVSYNAFLYPQNYNNCILYVPYGTSEAYRNAAEWSKFKNIIELDKEPDNINGHEYVDLGLPSGKLWAKTNYGSTTEDGYGSYVDWLNNGIITTYWGKDWATPTKVDIQELYDNCSFTWGYSSNNVYGCFIQGKNGNSIFLPAAGFRINGYDQSTGKDIYYWTSSPSNENDFAVALTGYSETETFYTNITYNYTFVTLPIRPVANARPESNDPVIPETVDLGLPSGRLWANINYGAKTEDDYGTYLAWTEIDTVSSTLGEDWIVPSQADFEELYNNCTFTWGYSNNNVYGCVIQGKNGNSLFLPAAGLKRKGKESYAVGENLYYWTSTEYDSSYAIFFEGSGGMFFTDGRNEYSSKTAMSVRPIMKTNVISEPSNEFSTTIDNIVWHLIVTDENNKYCAVKEISLPGGEDFFDSFVENIKIPVSCNGYTVKEIKSGAFYNLQVSSVTVPETIENIENDAFGGYLPYYVKSLIREPSDISENALGSMRGTFLYVPKGTKEKYLAAKGWNTAAAIIEVENPAEMQNGDYSKATVDGIEWKYQITSSSDKTCFIGHRHQRLGENAASPITTHMTVPSTLNGYIVSAIGDGAFQGTAVETITLPDMLSLIGESAFEHSKLNNIQIPQEVTKISTNAFKSCEGLTNITIPSKVETIGHWAFDGCPLSRIDVLATTPPTIYDDTFSDFNIPLYVPMGCIDDYKTHDVWKNFINISDGQSYVLKYIVDGEEYKNYEVKYGATITPEPAPTKEGYTFSGWSEIPETMPAHDVTVTGTFSINSYKLTYVIDDKVYKETMYEYGATIVPEPQPEGDYQTFEWIDLPQTMPAHDVIVYANYTSGIMEVLMASQRKVHIYSPTGKKHVKLQKGLNIVVFDDGTIHKIWMK